MKVLVIGKFDKESFGTHISMTLENMGHTVIRFPWGVQYSHSRNPASFYLNKLQLVAERAFWNTKWQESRAAREIEKHLNGHSVDLTISTHDFLRPGEVDLILKRTKSPVVLWYPDHIGLFDKHMFLNANYSAIFFKEPYIVKRLQSDFPGRNIYYLPECCNPEIHKIYSPVGNEGEKYECDITTAGNLYANRIAFFEQLSEMGLSIKIWGNPKSRWMNTSSINSYLKNEFVVDKEKGLAFSQAKIVLNNLHPCEVEGINCRAFEIPAMGGFQLINWRLAIKDLFEIDKEIVVFNSIDELKDKIKFYLNNSSARKSIMEAGHNRVVGEHTYKKRLTLLIETVFKNGKGYNLP